MDIRKLFFKFRGFTPIPFILILLYQSDMRLWTSIAGAILALIGEFIRINGVRAAGGRTRTRNVGAKELCTGGLFSHVRNPLYLGNIMIYGGMTLFAGGRWLLPLFFIGMFFFICQYALIISLEEGTLWGIFGETYREYCANVPRLFPRLSPWTKHAEVKFLSWKKVLKTEKSTLMVFGVFLVAVVLKQLIF